MTREKRAGRPLNERIGFWLTLTGLLLAIISIALYIWPLGFSQRLLRTFHLIVLSLWIIGPPAWFVVETQFLVADRQDWKLKQNQELLSKVWLGVSALLALLMNKIC
jgi:hypothetical protein